MSPSGRKRTLIRAALDVGFRRQKRTKPLELGHVLGGRTLERPFEAYEGDEPYVFVCYSHDDKAFVYPELTRLRDSGVHIWYDEGISPGSEWSDALAQKIEGCVAFLYFITPRSVETEHCRREPNFAVSESRRVLAVHLVPTHLPGGLKLTLSNRQAILKYEESHSAYESKLARAIGDVRSPDTSGTLTTDAIRDRRDEYPPRKSTTPAIAVLPFTNMSSDPEQAFFSDGISEDILNGLAQSADLVVRPRSSSFQFSAARQDSQAIGRRLNVSYVVEGSVRRSGNRVRVSAQLIDVASNRSIWSQRFDHELTDIFAVQDAITSEILSALNARLHFGKRTMAFASNEAHDAFLRGRHHFNRYESSEAEKWLTTAVELDPDNARIWALRANVNAFQSANNEQPNAGEQRTRRRAFIERALSIDPDNVSALANRALMDTHYVERNYQGAVDELVRLVTLHPNNEMALGYLLIVLAAIGNVDLLARVSRHLLHLAPFSFSANVGGILYCTALFCSVVDGSEQLRTALDEFHRKGFRYAYLDVQLALVEHDPAALRAIAGRDGADDWTRGWCLSLAAYLEGDFERASALMEKADEALSYVAHSRSMRTALIRRDLDGALMHFRESILAAEQHPITSNRGEVGLCAVFPELYADPRYMAIRKEFGLDPESTAKINVPELPF
jgi:TolB-like protein